MTAADKQARVQAGVEELLAENLRLRQLIGELLLKNQRLREGGTDQLTSLEFQKATQSR